MQIKRMCRKCGEEKHIKNFHRDKRLPHRRRSLCKLCGNKYAKDYRNNHKNDITYIEKMKKWNIEYRKNNRQRFNDYSREYAKKYRIKNKEKLYSYWHNRYINNKDKKRDKDFINKYGITLNDYNKMILKQNKRCLICTKEEKLFVDHDHRTNKIRGLLCRLCNTGLGCFSDNIEVMKKSICYINSARALSSLV